MRALHIIGEDFELRFGIDRRLIRKQQVAIGLLGVGFLGFGADKDLAIENAVGAAIHDPVIVFVTIAIRLVVMDSGMVIDKLGIAAEIKAVQSRFTAFTIENDIDIVPSDQPAKRN